MGCEDTTHGKEKKVMKRIKRTLLAVAMTIVWFILFAMVIPMKSIRGQFVTVVICLLINGVLALGYSFIDGKPASFRDWLKR